MRYKAKKRNNRRSIVVLCSYLLFLISCQNTSPKTKLFEEYLGIKALSSYNNIEISKININSDYERPYNVYIKFETGDSTFLELVKKLGLVSIKDRIKEQMCLHNTDSLFIASLWSFKSRNRYELKKEISSNLLWWPQIEDTSVVLYASFYKVAEAKKIEVCFQNKWDGRILVGFNKSNNTVYILIEVLRKNE